MQLLLSQFVTTDKSPTALCAATTFINRYELFSSKQILWKLDILLPITNSIVQYYLVSPLLFANILSLLEHLWHNSLWEKHNKQTWCNTAQRQHKRQSIFLTITMLKHVTKGITPYKVCWDTCWNQKYNNYIQHKLL